MEFKIGDTVDIPEGRGTVIGHNDHWKVYNIGIGNIVHTCTSKDMTLVSENSCNEKAQDPEVVEPKEDLPHADIVKSKLSQASTSLQDAYNAIKRELETNQDYYKAWVKKLSDEMEKTFAERVEEDDVNNILCNLFKITGREQKSFEDFHS